MPWLHQEGSSESTGSQNTQLPRLRLIKMPKKLRNCIARNDNASVTTRYAPIVGLPCRMPKDTRITVSRLLEFLRHAMALLTCAIAVDVQYSHLETAMRGCLVAAESGECCNIPSNSCCVYKSETGKEPMSVHIHSNDTAPCSNILVEVSQGCTEELSSLS